jgi:hypothetical protein
MGRVLSIALVTLLVGSGLLLGLGEAATVKRSLEQLSQEADIVVIGSVTRQVSTWNRQYTAIVTDITVTIDEHIKGWHGAEVTFRIVGGIVGDVGMRTSNDPVFQDGDRVILFLQTVGVLPTLVGHSQGAYMVSNGLVARDGYRVAVDDFVNAIRAASP